jgi:hypothetical protein
MVPPYWGVPELAHQLPVDVVVTVEVVGGTVTVLGGAAVVLVLITEVVVDVVVEIDAVVEVVVDVEQDTKIRDMTIKEVTINQISPRFMQTSLKYNY